MEKTLYGNKYIQILKDTIVALEEKNVQVYIVIHCGLDKEICDALCHITRKFVITIDCTEYGATMYDQIIDKFDFVTSIKYPNTLLNPTFNPFIPVCSRSFASSSKIHFLPSVVASFNLSISGS